MQTKIVFFSILFQMIPHVWKSYYKVWWIA